MSKTKDARELLQAIAALEERAELTRLLHTLAPAGYVETP